MVHSQDAVRARRCQSGFREKAVRPEPSVNSGRILRCRSRMSGRDSTRVHAGPAATTVSTYIHGRMLLPLFVAFQLAAQQPAVYKALKGQTVAQAAAADDAAVTIDGRLDEPIR